VDGRLRFGLSVLRSRCGMVFLIALRQWRPVNRPPLSKTTPIAASQNGPRTLQALIPSSLDPASCIVYLHFIYLHHHNRTHTHTHTHPFNGPLSGTIRVGRYQKGKTKLDFTEARDSEWQWHQLGHMQACTSFQTDNHASTSPLRFLQAGCPSCRPTNSVKALKAITHIITMWILYVSA